MFVIFSDSSSSSNSNSSSFPTPPFARQGLEMWRFRVGAGARCSSLFFFCSSGTVSGRVYLSFRQGCRGFIQGCGKSPQMLVPLAGVATFLRQCLEKDAWSMVKQLLASNIGGPRPPTCARSNAAGAPRNHDSIMVQLFGVFTFILKFENGSASGDFVVVVAPGEIELL